MVNITPVTSANTFVLLAALPSLLDTLCLQSLGVPITWKTNPYLSLADDHEQKGNKAVLDFKRQNQHKAASRPQVSEAAAALSACL